MPGFSLHHTTQTEPTLGSNSGIWNGEGLQYLHQDPSSQGHAQGFSDSFNLFSVQEAQTGRSHDRSSFSGSTRSQWKAELSATQIESAEMARFPSQDSIGAQSHRTTNSYDHSRSTRMYPSVSQMSYQMSSARSDVTGRSNSPDSVALYTPIQQIDFHGYDSLPYPSGDDYSGSQAVFHKGSTSGNALSTAGVPLTSGSFSLFPATGDENFVHVSVGLNPISSQDPVSRDSMIYNPGAIMESPTLWDNGTDFLDSQRSSPVLLETPWSLPAAAIMTSNANSPLDYSPSLEGLSPRYVEDFPDLVDLSPYTTAGNRATRKPIGPRPSKVASDLAAGSRRQRVPGSSDASDESFKMIGRSSLEIDNTARDHHLYHNVTPQADGLYHCPWEKVPNSNCQHKPEKLKCNYEYVFHFLVLNPLKG
jgi:hypothetical protein